MKPATHTPEHHIPWNKGPTNRPKASPKAARNLGNSHQTTDP